MNAKWILIAVLILILTACAPAAKVISTTTAPTRAAIPTETFTISPPTLTATLTRTYTPEISFTPSITNTPTITRTPTITLPPTLTFTSTAIPTGSATLPASAHGCIPENTTRETGVVSKIVDGDTIDVTINDQVYRVRYIGIDAPEKDGALYADATNYNRKLVSGKTVTLVKDVSESDDFDRLLWYVLVGEKFVNYELVKRGYAFAYKYPPDTSCSDIFVAAQRDAQGGKIGLWKPPSPGGSGSGGNIGSSKNCDTSYPGVCIPPPPPDLNCPDIPDRNFQVLSPDPHGFDSDHDGIGCEK